MRKDDPEFLRYVAACDYPGVLDAPAVEAALDRYLSALNVERKIVQIKRGWRLNELSDLRENVRAILVDFAQRRGRTSDALAALAASAASAASDASDASDASAARAASDASDALAASDERALERFVSWCVHRGYYWSWDLSWFVTWWFGARQKQLSAVQAWTKPLLDAYCAGAWMLYWTEGTLYWVAKPIVHIEDVNGTRRLHNDSGPAVESGLEDLYFVHGVLVPSFVVERPDLIEVAHMRGEENAEVRRIMRQRYGEGRYLADTGARVVHQDIETVQKGAAPRVLLEDDEKRRWLVGTDGSTKRCYYMEVDPSIKTCREAHESLCGFSEDRILNKS